MPRDSCTFYSDPKRCSFTIIQFKAISWGCQSLIKGEYWIICLETFFFNPHHHAIMSTNFFIRNKREDKREVRDKVSFLQNPTSFQILHADALHVLRTSCIDFSIINCSSKRIKFPVFLTNRNNIHVRIEKDRLFNFSVPNQQNYWFSSDQFDGFHVKTNF
eukprot:NODE_537_length_7002_cov_0.281762.p6 type:complete len:161 gc:universal NODE_537_length_7002_cov_0.281762:4943-5425(+)